MEIQDLLGRLDSAYKAITTSDITNGLLKPQKAEQFIRVVEESTPLLSAARRLDMKAPTREIDRIMFAGRILAGTGETDTVTNEQKVNTPMNKLDAQELTGFVGITDKTLEDNIEKGNFEDTLLDLTGGQVGLDLEHLFLSGDKTKTTDALLKVTDGWLKKAANKVTGSATPGPGQFDQTNVEKMFNAMLQGVPKKYLRNKTEWRYYVTWDMEDDYRDILRARQTALGDAAQTGAQGLHYKGIMLEYVPQMPAGYAMLAPANNLVYGIYREIRIERDRVPKARKTDFVVSLRADCHFEDENAVCVASGYVGPSN